MWRSLRRLLGGLLSPLAILCISHTPVARSAATGAAAVATDDDPMAQLLRGDASDLLSELERQAQDAARRYRFLSESGLHDDAEVALREAVASAPWRPEYKAALATHIMDHGSQRRVGEMMGLFRDAMRMQHALPLPPARGEKAGADGSNGAAPVAAAATMEAAVTAEGLMRQLHKRPSLIKHFTGTTFPARLKHDRDQLTLLGERGRLPKVLVDRYVEGYNTLLGMVPPANMMHAMNIPPNLWAKTIGSVFQRAVYVPEMEPLKGPALNPKLDFRKLEEDYFAAEPSFFYFDGLLTEEALLRLRQYYEEATIFWDSKPGYVGTYIFDGGFGNPVVVQLIDELMDAFPRLICSHRLNQAWAYKYDSELQSPIDIHADEAAVNFNFWVSPDEGNLDDEGGGLVVFRAVPPEGTPKEVFNQLPLHPNVTRMLAETGFANHTVPHRSNRAVVFQSNLFHQSGKMTWAQGYTKRRINLTLLFGKMYGKCDDGR